VHYSRGQAEAILTVLKARNLDVNDEERARIVTCTNLRQLKIWVRRAVRAEKTSDLFATGTLSPTRNTTRQA
jgi:hypothetical protein